MYLYALLNQLLLQKASSANLYCVLADSELTCVRGVAYGMVYIVYAGLASF